MSAGAPLRYCGRDFSAAEIDWLRALIARRPALRRAALSRALCERLGWRKPDGGLKDMSARVAMLRMHRDGLETVRIYVSQGHSMSPGRRTEHGERDTGEARDQ